MADTQIVALPSGEEVEFPASMSDDQIRAVMKRKFAPSSKSMSVDTPGLSMVAAQKRPQDLIKPETTFTDRFLGGLAQNANVLSEIGHETKNLAVGLVKSGAAVGNALVNPVEAARLISGAKQAYDNASKTDIAAGVAGFDQARFNENIAKGEDDRATVNALFPVASAILPSKLAELLPKSAGASRIAGGLQRSAETQYARAMAPTKEAMKVKAARVVPTLLEEGEVALTKKGLEAKASSRVAQFGQELEQAYSKLPANSKVSTAPILDALDTYAKDNFMVKGVPTVPEGINAVKKVRSVVEAFGKDMSVSDARRLRQQWDNIVAESNGFTRDLKEATLTNIRKEGADSIREELAKAHPDIAEINKKYSLWKNVETVMAETNKRTVGQGTRMGELVFGSGGLAAGATGGAGTAALGAGAAVLVRKAVTSTAWNTTSAVVKSRLADAIASGNSHAIARITLAIAAGGAKTAGREEQR
jgi:hypothetical protein